jgi:hypothetical protein
MRSNGDCASNECPPSENVALKARSELRAAIRSGVALSPTSFSLSRLIVWVFDPIAKAAGRHSVARTKQQERDNGEYTKHKGKGNNYG